MSSRVRAGELSQRRHSLSPARQIYSCSVETCTSLSEFLRAPVGRCVVGRTWLYFYPRIGLCGFAAWGRPTGDDMLDLSRVLAVELDQPPHVSLVDVHRMESLETCGG